jgi:putative hydrolase of the HAD superfamily
MSSSPHALVLDADNTLWNTNAVFQRAGARMMRALTGDAAEEANVDAQSRGEGATGDEKHRNSADLLYRLSQQLSPPETSTESTNAGLVQLARAAAFYASDLTPSAPADPPVETARDESATTSESGANRIRWAARQAESDQLPPGVGTSHLQAAATAFQSALETPPPLLDGARSLLRTVRAWREAGPDRRTSVLFSEGEPDRLRVAFRAYRIGNGTYFDEIVLKEKSPRTYRQVCQTIATFVDGSPPPPSGIVVVGDSLKRDIRPANAAGCTTVYCPGELWGRENPEGPEERPDYVVERIDEMPSLFGL